MGMQSMVDFKWPGLARPDGERITMNSGAFIAVDRYRDIGYDPIYRPQALYHRALEGLRANNDAFLLQEVATNLPIYRDDTGPTDFHLHLPPGGFQLVLVTSGLFTFDYDGQIHYVGPGAVMLQSAIVHRQLFYTWAGLSTEENLRTPQSVVPDPLCMGYSGKFLEAFITDPTTFPNPTVVGSEHIKEDETPRTAWKHPLHNRPAGAGFWFQDPLALDALFRPYPSDAADGSVKSASPVHVRDLGIETPSGNLVTGHIIATDPRGASLLPKNGSAKADAEGLAKGEVVIYRIIRGTAAFADGSGKPLELATGDTVTAGKGAIRLTDVGEDTQILRLGLLKGIEDLKMWTPTQRDEIDALAGQIITRADLRSDRVAGKPVGYLYE
ncbi:hypothetical protein [Xanthobacter oligotrophicus]|uniref:hypothetical protein n=1 Tax=Xanthobacter oligotrophicus TaxID=2607286 RepID=UPI0011F37BDD|nr:hypothetical protein [Xanthobacter oligotrophicus]MCG5233807.1 hypothetical protein [Xanthobacter oligotrophicus]